MARSLGKKARIIIAVILASVKVLAIVAFWVLTNRGIKPSDFSVPQHIKRISRLVEKNFLPDHPEYTDYAVYPLYDENDEFANYCLVEFQPTGFLYVAIKDDYPTLSVIYPQIQMYMKVAPTTSLPWQRFRYDNSLAIDTIDFEETSWIRDPEKPWDVDNRLWEADDNGEFIYRTDSVYKAAGVKDEKRYILRLGGSNTFFFIPAIRYEDKFLNLMSMEIYDYDPAFSEKTVPYIYLRLYISYEYVL